MLRYVGGVGGNALVGVPGKVIVSGFPVEAIVSDTHRTALLGAALSFLGIGIQPPEHYDVLAITESCSST